MPAPGAQSLAATPTMRGGANNYRPGAPIVERIGGGGFWMTGTVRRAGDGAPLAGRRIQIWAHTTEGNERDDEPTASTTHRRQWRVPPGNCRRSCRTFGQGPWSIRPSMTRPCEGGFEDVSCDR